MRLECVTLLLISLALVGCQVPVDSRSESVGSRIVGDWTVGTIDARSASRALGSSAEPGADYIKAVRLLVGFEKGSETYLAVYGKSSAVLAKLDDPFFGRVSIDDPSSGFSYSDEITWDDARAQSYLKTLDPTATASIEAVANHQWTDVSFVVEKAASTSVSRSVLFGYEDTRAIS